MVERQLGGETEGTRTKTYFRATSSTNKNQAARNCKSGTGSDVMYCYHHNSNWSYFPHICAFVSFLSSIRHNHSHRLYVSRRHHHQCSP